MSNLAYIYGELGDRKKQSELNEKACALRCKVLGRKHPDTLNSMDALAVTYVTAGDFQRALESFEEVYALSCEVRGVSQT